MDRCGDSIYWLLGRRFLGQIWLFLRRSLRRRSVEARLDVVPSEDLRAALRLPQPLCRLSHLGVHAVPILALSRPLIKARLYGSKGSDISPPGRRLRVLVVVRREGLIAG